MSGFTPLLALDIVLLFKVAIPLIAAVIWLLNQVLTKAKQAQPPRPAAPPPQRRPAAKAVEDEVEAFLRRAAQARSGQPQPTTPQRQPAPQRQPTQPRKPASVGRPMPSQSAAPPATARRPPPLPATAVEVVAEQPGEGVAAHVARHLDSSGFSERASHLTQLDQADEQMEAHIQQSLDHRVGQLAATDSVFSPTATPDGGVRSNLGLAAFLANPQNLRNAFIFSEVLRRPDA